MIKIDTFKPEYLKGQVELGQQTISKWLGGLQTPYENLKAAYSRSEFNPKEKFYAIDQKNKVVGFLTSSVKTNDDGLKIARMEFPVLDKSVNREIGSKLVDAAMSYFKKENVKEVISRASTAWGDTLSYVAEYQYELDRVLWKAGRLEISNYNFQISDDESIRTEAVDLESDQTEIVEILRKHRGLGETKAIKKVDYLSTIPERIISWRKITNNDKIIALSELVMNKYDASNAQMYSIFTGNEKHRDLIMDDHIKLAKKYNIETIDNFFEPPMMDDADLFQKYGFKIHQVSFYVKRL